MTDHTHTTLTEGCYRCDLNRDEAAAAHAEILADARFVLEHPDFYTQSDLLDLIDDLVAVAEYRKGG